MTLHLSLTTSLYQLKKCSICFNLVVQCIESVITVGSGSSICQVNLQKILCREEPSYYFILIFSCSCSCSHTEGLVEKYLLLHQKIKERIYTWQAFFEGTVVHLSIEKVSIHKISVHYATHQQERHHIFPLYLTWAMDFSVRFFSLSESVASMVEKILGISFVCCFTIVKSLKHPNSKIFIWVTTRVSTDKNTPRISISSCWDMKKWSISQNS